MIRNAFVAVILMLVASGFASAQTDQVAYYHTDAVGSVRMITDQNGQVVARYDYLPFGEPWNPPTPQDPRQFAGKERDQETSFDYFGARHYASGNGRFTTADPVLDIQQALLEPQLWNRYAYVTNNPLRFRDPDGRQRDALDQDIRALLASQITVEEYNARIQARGVGAAVGALLAAGPTAWRVAVSCFLSPSCQSSAIEALEGAAGGAPTSLNRSALLDDAVATSRAGVSKAGRALQSHAERGGWLAGEAMAGNAAENTKAAKRVLEMVLERGETTFGNHPTFGKVIRIRLPDGSGAWWKENGEFIGYLERYTPKQ